MNGRDLSWRRNAVDRLEAGDREHDQAVAAGTGLALDVIEILDRDFIFLSTGRAEDRYSPHASHRGFCGGRMIQRVRIAAISRVSSGIASTTRSGMRSRAPASASRS